MSEVNGTTEFCMLVRDIIINNTSPKISDIDIATSHSNIGRAFHAAMENSNVREIVSEIFKTFSKDHHPSDMVETDDVWYTEPIKNDEHVLGDMVFFHHRDNIASIESISAYVAAGAIAHLFIVINDNGYFINTHNVISTELAPDNRRYDWVIDRLKDIEKDMLPPPDLDSLRLLVDKMGAVVTASTFDEVKKEILEGLKQPDGRLSKPFISKVFNDVEKAAQGRLPSTLPNGITMVKGFETENECHILIPSDDTMWDEDEYDDDEDDNEEYDGEDESDEDESDDEYDSIDASDPKYKEIVLRHLNGLLDTIECAYIIYRVESDRQRIIISFDSEDFVIFLNRKNVGVGTYLITFGLKMDNEDDDNETSIIIDAVAKSLSNMDDTNITDLIKILSDIDDGY